MPGTPILTQIEENMSSLIQGMQPGLYHFMWGSQSVNDTDLARVTFPCANIYLESDTSLDDINGSHCGAYYHESTYRIEVMAKLEEERENPRWAINAELSKAFDDLRKLFGRNYNINGTADTIMYRDMQREFARNGDIFIPSKMITYWVIRWESDRQSPDLVA